MNRSIFTNLLSVVSNACVQFYYMISNEPNKIAKVRSRSSVPYECQHRRILHSVDVQRQSAYRDANHSFGVVEELYGFGVEREVICVLKIFVFFIIQDNFRETIESGECDFLNIVRVRAAIEMCLSDPNNGK